MKTQGVNFTSPKPEIPIVEKTSADLSTASDGSIGSAPEQKDPIPATIKAQAGLALVSNQIQEQLVFPEEIYAVIEIADFALLKTLLNPETALPIINYFHRKPSQINENEILLTFRNNGFIGIKSREDFDFYEMEDILLKGSQVENKIVDQNNLFLTAYRLVQFRNSLSRDKKIELDQGLAQTVNLSSYRTDVEYSPGKKPSLERIIIKGQEYSLEEFQRQADKIFPLPIELGIGSSNLYRAVTTDEWRLIQERGNFLVRHRDNFEGSIGPQVSAYCNEEGYAGVIIRVPVKGPYFVNAGLQVPRISCALPHFINASEIEVSMDQGKTFKVLQSQN